jgi:hypothetical protein
VNVFDLDRALVSDYQRFASSFTQIRTPDIRSQVENLYVSNRFWPDPLISINPHFERGAAIDRLAADGTVHGDTARVFRVERHYVRLHRHQEQAVAKAAQRQSFLSAGAMPASAREWPRASACATGSKRPCSRSATASSRMRTMPRGAAKSVARLQRNLRQSDLMPASANFFDKQAGKQLSIEDRSPRQSPAAMQSRRQ